MLSQGHMGAPFYRYTGQVGPRFGKSGLHVKWKWCHILMVEADIHVRPLHTSIVDINKVFKLLVCYLKGVWVHPYCYTGQVGPRFGKSESFVEWKWCHNVMIEADIPFRPLHTSILDVKIVFEPLVCCLKGIWVHPYTVTLAKLAPDLGLQVHLRSGNDATTSWLRLILTSNHFIHPYWMYKKCLSLLYAVSRAYGCILILLHWPSCPQIWEVRFTWGVEMMTHYHVWGWYSPQTASYIHVYIYNVFETLVCCLKGIWLHPYSVTSAKLAPDLGIQVHLRSGNDATTSCLRLIFTSDCFIHPY